MSRSEKETRSGHEAIGDSREVASGRQTSGFDRPRLDVGPVPSGASADGPLRSGQHVALLPLIDGGALHAEALGDLGDSDGVGGHGSSVERILTDIKVRCRDYLYIHHYPKGTR
jgi:hypothetical protein